MLWKGKELRTVGDLMNAMGKLVDEREAQDFMRLYRAENEHADQNIGYLTGYFSREDTYRLQLWCGVAHPVFGKAIPTSEGAFAKGLELGSREYEANRRR
jgi:hypothetical protein